MKSSNFMSCIPMNAPWKVFGLFHGYFMNEKSSSDCWSASGQFWGLDYWLTVWLCSQLNLQQVPKRHPLQMEDFNQPLSTQTKLTPKVDHFTAFETFLSTSCCSQNFLPNKVQKLDVQCSSYPEMIGGKGYSYDKLNMLYQLPLCTDKCTFIEQYLIYFPKMHTDRHNA